jgi:hypothetical protein
MTFGLAASKEPEVGLIDKSADINHSGRITSDPHLIGLGKVCRQTTWNALNER